MKHLIDIKSLSQSDIQELFSVTQDLSQAAVSQTKRLQHGKSAVALFFENSTRTLCSFQMACQRIGVDVTALNIAHSSTQKGESIRDTLLTLNAMRPDCFIVRHQENHLPEQIIEWLDNQTSVINAGDGTNQHPTQGLLDLYTIHQHKADFSSLKVCIIGDIKHSRVANSLLDGLAIMGTKQVDLFAPDSLIPANHAHLKAASLQQAIQDSDVVVMLRIQKERLTTSEDLAISDWHAHYGLNQQRLTWAKPNAIVMHPGPINRGVEISDAVADGPQSVILEQVANGVLMRQALLHQILSH